MGGERRTSRLSLLLLPSSLLEGGTERQVVNLAIALAARGHDVVVAVPYRGDPLQIELDQANIRLVYLLDGEARRSRSIAAKFSNIARRTFASVRVIRRERFDVLYSFGSTTNFYAAVIGFAGPARVVWGIRDSRPGPARGFRSLEKVLAHRAPLVIANSEAGRRSWVARGLPDSKIVVIPNGIDCDKYRIDSAWRDKTRTQFDVETGCQLVGIVGRTHPVKNHELFLEAARIIVEQRSNVKFILVGRSTEEREIALKNMIRELELEAFVIWAGPTAVPERLYNAFDLTVSCSITEGFSNVLAESMACGTPCVATDVGDAREIVDGFGTVLTKPSATALAKAIMDELDQHRGDAKREAIRESVVSRYSLHAMVDRTEKQLGRIANGGRVS